jgi:multidrug resistance efflux pump
MIAQRAAGVDQRPGRRQGRAKADLVRYDALAKQGWVSPRRSRPTQAGAAQSAAAVQSAQAALEAERRTAQSLGSARAQTVAQAAAARAAVEQARIDLDRTVIRAPAAGVVGARAVRPGQLVQPGVALMSIVPVGQGYIVANFKETQVSRLRVGQPVEIKADAFGKSVIHGKLDSFAPATGQEFALIPVENAVGNFTKITQRLPVKIVVDRSRSWARPCVPACRSTSRSTSATARARPSPRPAPGRPVRPPSRAPGALGAPVRIAAMTDAALPAKPAPAARARPAAERSTGPSCSSASGPWSSASSWPSSTSRSSRPRCRRSRPGWAPAPTRSAGSRPPT